MKILICSDTHGDQKILTDKIKLYPYADHYFYLGDSELSENNPIFQTFDAVQGNMDYGNFPLVKVVKDQKINFLLTHGHRFNVNQGLEELLAEGKQNHANIICFGHTHRLTVKFIDQILFINPGSISQPRNFITERGTYVILEITAKEYQIFCYNRQDQLLQLEENPIIIKRTK